MATETIAKHPTKRQEILKRAGMSMGSELTPEQVERADKAPAELTGDRLREQIMGKRPPGGGKPRRRAQAKEADLEAATIGYDVAASKGKPLSQRIGPAQIVKVRKALAKMEGGTVPEKLAVGEQKLRKFAAGEIVAKDLPEKARVAIKELTRKVGDHQVWARKAAAGAVGVMLADRGK